MIAAMPAAELVIDQLAQSAERAPHAPLLPERSGDQWQIAQGFGPDGRSLAVPAGDTPERAVLLLGALRAGALVVPGPSAVEFAVLVHCSIDAAVAERRLHIDAKTPARRSDDSLLRHGDFATIAAAVAE
jgi:acyl-CoA synthetase (AMP-forming)/AMP-acid ligase II